MEREGTLSGRRNMAARQHKEQGIPQGRVQGRSFQTLAAGWHIAAGVPRKVHYDDTEECSIGVSG